MDVAVDKRSVFQTTVQCSRFVSTEVEATVWNQDCDIPLLHLRSQVVLSLFVSKNNALIGQTTLQVASLPRTSDSKTDVVSALSACKHILRTASQEGTWSLEEGHLSATAVVQVMEHHVLGCYTRADCGYTCAFLVISPCEI